MTRPLALILLVAALSTGAALAQLPPVGLPQVPDLGAPQIPDLGETLNETAALADVRRLRIRELLRSHRGEIEADPSGQPIVRSQIIALGMSEAAIESARAAGFEIVRTDDLGLGAAMVTLRAPQGMSTRRALRRLRQADPAGAYDFDHLHLESGAALTLPLFAQAGAARAGPRIGLIDSGVGASANVVAERAFAINTPVAGEHGATVAAILSSAAPGARIYAADIYGGAPTGGASSALARALGWLAQENVAVINISLVGPRNRVIEAVVARMVARGFIIVAAVGNDGPAAAPLFPAAYDGVVGVTGVDARERVLIEAGRGAQVDFAALGAYGRTRGTSYAAPVVAARLAGEHGAPGNAGAQEAIGALRRQARDLGPRGRDDIYGYGLITAP